MPKDNLPPDDTEPKALVRSVKEIKAGLLRSAWDGKSTRPASELIAMIQERVKRSAEMPAEHVEILKDVQQIGEQPAAIMRLNAMEREKGSPTRYVDASSQQQQPVASTYMDGPSTFQ